MDWNNKERIGTWTLYRLLFSKRKRHIENIVPLAPGSLPIVGHAFAINRDPRKFLAECREKYGSAFRLNLAGRETFVLTGRLIPELLFASRKQFSFTEGVEVVVPTQRVLHLSYDHKHKEEEISPRDKHPIVFPVKQNFKPEQISVFSERIQKAFLGMLDEKLALKSGERRTLATWDFLSEAISRISCLCFAGSRVGTNKDLVLAMASFTQNIIKAGMLLTILPDFIADVVVRRIFSVEQQLDLLMELIVPELEKIASGELPDDEATFISMVLKLPKADGSYRSPRDAAFYFKEIALASIHTTSHFTTFALHELACRPKLVTELRDMISKVGPERTPENVSEIPLLDSFLREVLRHDIDYMGLHHKALKDVVLSTGQVIPEGSLVVAALEDAHVYPMDPPPAGMKPLSEFDPYRFLNMEDDKWSSTIGNDLISFGLGGHACPGRYFAVNEIKYVLAELIMRYNDFPVMGMVKFPPREPLIFEGI
ncbi:cytochrome P450 [Lichtheimia hyalospora FSU 10163]|nr:cytochrome P450 [Lichtheimia hyalospora FSU 10163]